MTGRRSIHAAILSGALALSVTVLAVTAGATERETLVNRCWITGIPPASAYERTPRRAASLAHSPLPRPEALEPPVAAALRGSIRRVELPPGAGKLVALTFDLCERQGEIAGYDGSVIDYLRRHDVRATLFVGGQWMTSHAERTEQLLAEPLFEVGTHGWAHRNLRLLAADDLKDEVRLAITAYERGRARLVARQCAIGQRHLTDLIPARPVLFRFPFGACHAASLDEVARSGQLAIQWDVSSGDPDPGQTAEKIVANVMRSIRPGSIVIFHANGRGHHTAEALAILIPRLRSQGYRFVTVSALLAAGRPVIAPTCYDHRPGDTERYDRLFPSAKPKQVPPHVPSERPAL